MTNKLVFLFSFYFFLNFNAFAQYDSTETLMCINTYGINHLDTSFQINYFNSQQLLIKSDYCQIKNKIQSCSTQSTNTFDLDSNLILKEILTAPYKRYIYSWLPNHRISNYQEYQIINGNWTCVYYEGYTYNTSNLLFKTTNWQGNAHDSTVITHFYDANKNDTLTKTDSYKNSILVGTTRLKRVFVNNLEYLSISDYWDANSNSYIPNQKIIYHRNTEGFETRIYYYNFFNGVYYFNSRTHLTYINDSLLSSKHYYLDKYDSLYVDATSHWWTYYPNGLLWGNGFDSYASSYGSTVYNYDDWDSLSETHHYTSTMGGLESNHDCYYYHYSITGSNFICPGDTLTLTAPPAASYLWNNNQTSQSIRVATTGIFQCTITLFDGRTFKTSPKSIVRGITPKFPNTTPKNWPNCSNILLNLEVTNLSNATFQWYRNDTSITGQNTFHLLLPAGNYSYGDYYAVATNTCGDDTSSIFHVTEKIPPSTAVITASGALQFCKGTNVTLSSNLALSYSWFPGNQKTQSIVVSTSGKYYVTNFDGCYSSDTVVVKVLHAPTVSPVISKNQNKLSTQVNYTPCQWYMNGIAIAGATSSVYKPSTNGTYTVKFISADSTCSRTSAPFNYVADSLKINLISHNLVICSNDTVSGIGLNADPTSGYYNFNYQWQPAVGLTNPNSKFTNFKNASSGWYILTVQDAQGIIVKDSVYVLIKPAPPTPQIVKFNSVYCKGGLNQLLGTTAQNTDGYFWVPSIYDKVDLDLIDPMVFGYDSIYKPEYPESYKVRVLANNGCWSNFSPYVKIDFVSSYLPRPALKYYGKDSICGGTGVYLATDSFPGCHYVWMKNVIDSIPNHDSPSLKTVPNQNYILYRKDTLGCELRSDQYFVPNYSIGVSIDINASNLALCANDSMQLTASYSPSYSYTWYKNNSPIVGSDTNSIYIYTDAQYKVWVSDSSGCFGSKTISIYKKNNSPSAILCKPSNLVAFSLYPITAYQWYFNSSPIIGANTATIPLTAKGVYSLETKNNAGCKYISNFDFQCNLNVESGIADCADTCSMSINATPMGAPPFAYTWNSVPVLKNVNNICPGSYTMQLTDKNGCIARDTILLQSFHAFASTPAIVVSGNHLSSNVNHFPLQWYYNGTPIPGATTSDLYPTQFGNYQLEFISDDSTCTKLSLPFSFAPLQLYATDTPVSFCKNDTLAGIGLDTEPTMGVPPFTYQWEPSAGLSQPTEFFTHFNATNSGWYTLTVTDAIGQSGKDSVEVNFLNSPVATITSQKGDTICNADSTLLSTNYDSTYHYTWYQNGQQIFNLDSNQIYANSGAYAVIIRNPQGCTASASISIHASAHPQFTLVKQNLTLHAISNENLNYQWFLDSVPLIGIQYDSLLISTQGIYSVVATNSFGCSSTQNFIFKCSLKLNSTYSSCTDSCSWSLNANSTGEAPIQYLWNTTAQTQNLTNVCSGFYKLMQIDKQGCTVSDSIVLTKISAEISLDSIQNTSCIGCNDGAVYFTDAGPYSILFPQADTSYSNSFSGLVADTFSICAVSYTGCIICRTVIIYDEPLSVSSLHSTAEVLVYPNPFSDKTNFVFTKQDNYSIQILDVLGREVGKLISNGRNLVTFNREELSDGIYFYQIKKNESIIFSGKMVAE